MIAKIDYALNLDGRNLMLIHPAIARKSAIVKTLKPFTFQLNLKPEAILKLWCCVLI